MHIVVLVAIFYSFCDEFGSGNFWITLTFQAYTNRLVLKLTLENSANTVKEDVLNYIVLKTRMLSLSKLKVHTGDNNNDSDRNAVQYFSNNLQNIQVEDNPIYKFTFFPMENAKNQNKIFQYIVRGHHYL